MPKNADDERHRSEDRTGRFPKDMTLRLHGFRIWYRPTRGESVWIKDGKTFTYSQALKEIRST